MAGESYYYCISLVLTLSAVLWLLSLLLLRKGKTLFGITLKSGTQEYERGVKLASNRNLAITVFLALGLIVNLVYDVNRLMRLDEYRGGGLILLTVFVLLLFVLIIPVGRKQARIAYDSGKRKQK